MYEYLASTGYVLILSPVKYVWVMGWGGKMGALSCEEKPTNPAKLWNTIFPEQSHPLYSA